MIQGGYTDDTSAHKASEILQNRGFSVIQAQDTHKEMSELFTEREAVPAGIFLGGIVGMIAGFIVFFITGVNALSFGNGVGPFMWTIIVVGVVGALTGGFLGSFISLGIAKDMSMYHAREDIEETNIAIQCEKDDEKEVYVLLQESGARKIQTLTKEEKQRTIPGYKPRLAIIGSKGGSSSKNTKKGKKETISSSRTKTNRL